MRGFTTRRTVRMTTTVLVALLLALAALLYGLAAGVSIGSEGALRDVCSRVGGIHIEGECLQPGTLLLPSPQTQSIA